MNIRLAISRYWHTLRYLRAGQIYHRLRFRLVSGCCDPSPAPPLRRSSGSWIISAEPRCSMTGAEQFRFLNEERTLAGWDNPGISKLWRYNLHYFDDLRAEGAETRRAWHNALIERWIRENPLSLGSGWEPYPCSLRIVNWVKYALSGHALTLSAQHSLAVQVRWLASRIEWHILGNHLLANAKALVFAGCFFDGPEADRWRVLGMSILARELPEQILQDGGHFERSPMYHALILEDILDLINLMQIYVLDAATLGKEQSCLQEELEDYAMRMRRWLALMCHPDGEISFFNDAAFGISPTPAQLEDYAQRLGQPRLGTRHESLVDLAETGYLRAVREEAVVLIDAAPVGPDYLPAHAHADTLSFEFSLGCQRVLVNAGTSLYGNTPERLRQRGTAAHNTVVIDAMNSSEVWHGFRVARRARVNERIVESAGKTLTIRAAHDGFSRLPGRPIHRRSWVFESGSLVIEDTISGSFVSAVAYFHFHPDIVLQCKGRVVEALLPGGRRVEIALTSDQVAVEDGSWHPEFGLSLPNKRLAVRFDGSTLGTRINWAQ